MRILNRRKTKETVTVSILHRRSNYPENIEFMNVYKLVQNPELDLKSTMQNAFQKAHPDWKILEINLQIDS
jgi:hypothetical protein